jgi:biopolymer transport protein ExbB/TolQ
MEVVKFFQTGGPFMYPILVVLALGIAIAIERFLYITRTHRNTNRVWGQLVPMLKASDYERAMKMTEKQTTPLALMLNYGFSRLASTRRRDDIEAAMEEGMMEVMPELEQRTHYLATFANIATLLGLLGTIIGLIQAFTAVAAADPAEKADLLSASISVAMNTTAFGLVAAIPMILLHSYLQTKTARLIDNLEMAAVKCLNLIAKEG